MLHCTTPAQAAEAALTREAQAAEAALTQGGSYEAYESARIRLAIAQAPTDLPETRESLMNL